MISKDTKLPKLKVINSERKTVNNEENSLRSPSNFQKSHRAQNNLKTNNSNGTQAHIQVLQNSQNKQKLTIQRKRAYTSQNKQLLENKIQKPYSQVTINSLRQTHTNQSQKGINSINKNNTSIDNGLKNSYHNIDNNNENLVTQSSGYSPTKNSNGSPLKGYSQQQLYDFPETSNFYNEPGNMQQFQMVQSQDTPSNSNSFVKNNRRRFKSDQSDQINNLKSKISQRQIRLRQSGGQNISNQTSQINSSRTRAFSQYTGTQKNQQQQQQQIIKKQQRNLIQNQNNTHMPVVYDRNIQQFNKSDKKAMRQNEQLLSLQAKNNEQYRLSQRILENAVPKKNNYSNKNYKNKLAPYFQQQSQSQSSSNSQHYGGISNTISFQNSYDHNGNSFSNGVSQSNSKAQLFQKLSIEKYINQFSKTSGKRKKKNRQISQNQQYYYDQNQQYQDYQQEDQQDNSDEINDSEHEDKMTIEEEEQKHDESQQEPNHQKRPSFSHQNFSGSKPVSDQSQNQNQYVPSSSSKENSPLKKPKQSRNASRSHSRHHSRINSKRGSIINQQNKNIKINTALQQQLSLNQSIYSQEDGNTDTIIKIENPVLNSQNLNKLPETDKFFSTDNLHNQFGQNNTQNNTNNINNNTNNNNQVNFDQSYMNNVNFYNPSENQSDFHSNLQSVNGTRRAFNSNLYQYQATESGVSAFAQTGFNNPFDDMNVTNPGSDDDYYLDVTQQESQDMITQV